MTRRMYAGGAARTTITGSIPSSGGGTVTIATATGWPSGSTGKFHVVVDPGSSSEEKILMDSLSGSTLTFSAGGRGADGSTATSHSSSAVIWLCYTAVDADEANAHVNATVAGHAATAISFSPTGNVAATTVQAAIAEVDSETDSRLDSAESSLASILTNGWVTAARTADGTVLSLAMTSTSFTGSGLSADFTWTTETSDPNGFISAPSTTATVPASFAGLYVISVFADVVSGTNSSQIYIVTDLGASMSAPLSGFDPHHHSMSLRLAVGSTIKAGLVNNGTTANFTATLTATRLSA